MPDLTNVSLILVLISIIVYQGIINWLDRKDARRREADLLNRIIADSFSEYVDGSQRLARKPDDPMSSKERIQGLNLAEKMETDILEVV